jgi:acyl-CoA thioesterase
MHLRCKCDGATESDDRGIIAIQFQSVEQGGNERTKNLDRGCYNDRNQYHFPPRKIASMHPSRSGFAQVRSSLRPQTNGFVAEIPPDWRQGRTAFGGVTVGLATAAARLSLPELPPLRSMLVNFTGPVTNSPRFVPNCLRQGKSVTTIQVTVESEQQIAAQIVFCFGSIRDSALAVAGPESPLQRVPQEYELFLPQEAAGFTPAFAAQFETRLVAGSRPLSGASEGYMRVVSRHRDEESRQGIEGLITIADVLPPAALAMANAPAPISSITWMMNLLSDDPTTEQGWWQLESVMTSSEHGYSSQRMRLWSLDGALVAEGLQSVAQFF